MGFLRQALSEQGIPSASRLVGFVGLVIVCPALLVVALPKEARQGAFEVLSFMYGSLYGVNKLSGIFQRNPGSATTTIGQSTATTTTTTSNPPAPKSD